jgi:uncharacterized protein YbcI
MPAHRAEHEAETGRLGASISNAVVRLLAEYTGRGPTKARTTIRSDMVIVLLQDTLTKGERVLVRNGRAENVLALRSEFQGAMREEVVAVVEELVGRKVIAFMSTNHIDPDLAAEVFVLEDGGAYDPIEVSAV